NQRVYSGGNQASLLRQSIAGRDGARADLAQAGVLIAEAVGNAWAGLAIANAQVQAGDRQIRASQTAFDGVREEASLGARTTLDVLNAEQELLDARVTRIQAEAQRYLGVYRVLQTMGLLSVEHLKLGIPTYDPAGYYNAVKNAPVHSAQGKKLDRILEKLK
ncbi:TolC family protein, partial [Pseudotabrizicola sp.]